MKNLLILSLLLLAINAFSQTGYVNGYVVKNSGDTIRGQIYFSGWDLTPKQIQFKDANGAEQLFSAAQLKSFSITGVDNYLSKIIAVDISPIQDNDLLSVDTSILQIDTIFLRIIVNGPASLYYYHGQDQKEHFFIDKNNNAQELVYHRYKVIQDGVQYNREDKKFIGQLIYYLSDCPEMRSGLSNLDYSESSLQPIFISYAQCKGSNTSYIAQKNSSSAKLGVIAGASFSNELFSGDAYLHINNAAFNTSVSPSFGLKLDFYLIPKNKNFSFYNDINYVNVSFVGHGSYNSSSFLFTQTYKVDISYLFLNSMIRYYFGQGDWKPFINGGITNAFIVKKGVDSLISVETSPYGLYQPQGQQLFITVERATGLDIGAGLLWKNFSLEFRDIYWSGFVHESGFSSNINTIQALAGYQF
jgi:hypothetical protein